MGNEEIDLKKLQDLIKEIEIKKNCRSLSDEYLLDHNCSTRDDIGIDEYAYGIIMIPEDWVLPYLKHLIQLNDFCLSYEEDLSVTEVSLKKAEKIIDEMAKWIFDKDYTENSLLIHRDDYYSNCIKQVKQYFEKKVDENDVKN